MSYGGYNQGGGYGQPNPYDQRGGGGGGYGGGGYGRADPYTNNPYSQGGGGGGAGGYEMQPMNGGQGGYAQPAAASDPNQILNDCMDVNRGIDQIERDLSGLQSLQYNVLHSSGDPRDNQAGNQRLEQANDAVISSYTNLVQRMKKIKGMHNASEPRNAAQVDRVDRRLKATIQKYQTTERDFRRELQESIARQYRIVRPDATEEEVQQATEDSTQQVFSQALMQSNRRGQAQSTLSNVSARHEAIQKIERDMITLAQLFQDLETAVIEQEPLVENIEQKGEQVHQDVKDANTEIEGAVKSTRARNRKKWWCLGITILIIIIIAVVVAVVVEVMKNNNSSSSSN